MILEKILPRQDLLGEGIIWLDKTQQIAWVDILGQKFMLAEADGSNIREYNQKNEIGAVLPAHDGKLILVLRHKILSFDEASGKSETLWSASGLEPKTNRFNDAGVDPLGNLWISSMDFDAQASSGNLWRLTPSGLCEKMVSDFRCLNGPVFSADGKTLYLGDTMAGEILAYDLEIGSGQLFNKRIFVDLKPFGGLPDGMTIDSHGNIWVCQITAGRVGCYSPNGKKISSIACPVPVVTSCCFGGKKLKTLYATTARIILDPIDLDAYPDSGSLFAINLDVEGVPPNEFGASC